MYLTILKSTGSYGNWVIHLTPITSQYFWNKKDAINYLNNLTQ